MKNSWDVLHAHSNPINRNAANAISGGLNYNPSACDHIDYDLPPLMKSLNELSSEQKKLIGYKSFRLTVVGLAAEQPKNKLRGARYVCRCECGTYTNRSAKRLTTVKYQACGVCLAKRDRIIKEHYRKTGTYMDDALAWEKMGAV